MQINPNINFTLPRVVFKKLFLNLFDNFIKSLYIMGKYLKIKYLNIKNLNELLTAVL